MDAWEKFKKNIETTGLVRDNDRVLLAVSGGPDSVCLLHLFWRLRKSMPLTVYAATLDHGLRPRAKREALLVQRLGKKFSIETFLSPIPVRSYAAEKKISLETAGRELRYATFNALARDLRCNRIATGHTANDNAETMLMWLMRGTGPEGLSGIPPVRPAGGKTAVIRPLLPVTRPEIMAYLKRQKLPYRIDASNFSPDYTRNRIRHRVMPLLTQFNPRLVEHLFSLSRILGAENEFLNEFTAKAVKKAVCRRDNGILLDLKVFFRYNKIVQARIIKEILPEKRTWPQVERLREWISEGKNDLFILSGAWIVKRKNNRLQFEKTRKR
jgi:tRNA(Ile)-lysidine synthase